MYLLLLAGLCGALFVMLYRMRRENIKHLEHIPGPPTNNWWLGNSSELRDPVVRVETITRWRKQYGPVFKLTGGILTHSEVILVDPEIENSVMRIAEKGKGFWPFQWFMKCICRTQALFILDGHEWEKRRREVMHQGFMYSDLPANFKALDANMQKIINLIQSKKTPTDIHQLASVVLIDSMSETLYGAPMGVIDQPDHALVSTFEGMVKEMAIVQNYPLHFFTYKTFKSMWKLRESLFLSNSQVAERVNNPAKFEGCVDVCTRLVKSGVLDRKTTASEVTAAIIAASGNPSLSIIWLLFTLVKHQHIKAKLEAELSEVLGERGSPTFEDIKGMKYLDKVVQETLRMFIPDAIHRRANTDLNLHGIHIPEGTQIWIPSFLSHFEKVGPNPYEFNPDRFDADEPIRIHPFGGGPRICLGHMWTKLAIKVVIANIVHNFNFTLDPNNPPVIPEFHMLLFESAKIKFFFERKPMKRMLSVSLSVDN